MKELIFELKSRNIYLSVEKDELVIDFDGEELPAELISKIKSNKLLLVEYLSKYNNKSDYSEIPCVSQSQCYQISSAQRRLWILSQFNEGSIAYNISNSIYLNYKLELASFMRAIDSLIDRHEILRTVFRLDDTGEIRQWVLKREDLDFKIDYRDFRKESEKKERVNNYIAKDSYKAFDLETGPLLRAGIFQLEDEEYVFYFNMHHIISDGWSMEVLSKDVFSYYEAYKENREPALKELRIQYKDYSAWQLTQLEEESFKAHRTYWLNNLSGEVPLLDLPGAKQRPKIKTNKGHVLATYVSSETTGKLKKYSHDNGGSLFMGLLTAWNVLMYHYTSQPVLITGTLVAGRNHSDLEDQIGFYVNALPLKNRIDPEENFNELFSRVKQNMLKAYSHQMYPFDMLVEELGLVRDTSRGAVFDVVLTLQNNGEKLEGIELKKEEINRIIDLGYSTSKFEIEITVQEIGNYLSLRVVYNPDVYAKEVIEGMIIHYRELLNALLESPIKQISQIDYLPGSERKKLLVTFNNTQVYYPKEKTLVDLIEEQVEKTPDNIAVVFGKKELTYRELNEASNQLAHYLQKSYKIKPDDLVGIKLERSEWMIISLLGVLKAGGAYVPIDPEYPQDRIDYIAKDTNCKVCIDNNELNRFKENQREYSKKKVLSLCRANNLAYVIYTSGSTGKPKGVLVEHSGVVNRLLWMQRDLKINEGDVFLQKTPFTFDVSVWELLLAFIAGSKLVVCAPGGHKNPVYLEDIITNFRVSVAHFVPSMLSATIENLNWKKFTNLRHVICSGEALPKKLEDLFQESAPQVRLHNYYGPTEASIDVTAIDLSQFPTTGRNVSIGRPIDNTSIYIVNEKYLLQPSGVLGEILIGGVQIARGYLNQIELTKEKFIASPFKEGERLYRTGDIGRWMSDGTIEFVGRKDNQVKIRGYRIELGEIEHALLKNANIKEALVLAKEGQNNEKELVAYITFKEEKSISSLKNYLKATLPEYMIPTYYVPLETLPITSNGKVDRESLPDHIGLELANGLEYIAPRNEIEKKLVIIWEELLQKKNIGVRDDFFALGGQSLKAMRLIVILKSEFGFKLDISDFFDRPTIENTAIVLNFNSKQQQIKSNAEKLREIEL